MAESTEELLNMMYNMIQDAPALGRNKCIADRTKLLEILTEIIAELPQDIDQARKIVDAKNQIISEAKRDAEAIQRQADEKAKQLISHDAVVIAARAKSNEIIDAANAKSRELKQAANQYVDDALKRTEDALGDALSEVRASRTKFRAAKGN